MCAATPPPLPHPPSEEGVGKETWKAEQNRSQTAKIQKIWILALEIFKFCSHVALQLPFLILSQFFGRHFSTRATRHDKCIWFIPKCQCCGSRTIYSGSGSDLGKIFSKILPFQCLRQHYCQESLTFRLMYAIKLWMKKINHIDKFIKLLSFHFNSDPLRHKVPNLTGSGFTTMRRTHLASLVRVVAVSPHTRSSNPQVVSK